MEAKGKRKVNIIGLLVIIFFIYLIGSFAYYLFSLPIKNIYIHHGSINKDTREENERKFK